MSINSFVRTMPRTKPNVEDVVTMTKDNLFMKLQIAHILFFILPFAASYSLPCIRQFNTETVGTIVCDSQFLTESFLRQDDGKFDRLGVSMF